MLLPSDRERLLHIQEAIKLLAEYTAAMTLEQFLAERKTQLAVERLLEILGEATAHMSEELKLRHSHVPWRQITGLRNIISHEYFRVRLELL